MKFGLIFLFFWGSSGFICGDNLILNPGFEDGLNHWDELWCREAGKGRLSIVNAPVYSGKRALKLEHWGGGDWSFQPEGDFVMEEETAYVFSCWVKATKIKDWAELSFAVFDSSGEVLDWAAGSSEIAGEDSFWVYYEARLFPQKRGRYFWPRIIGGDSCELVLDDFSLKKIDWNPPGDTVVLTNEKISFSVAAPHGEMKLWDAAGNNRVMTEGLENQVVSVSCLSEDSCVLSVYSNANQLEYSVYVVLDDEKVKFELSAAPDALLNRELYFPGRVVSKVDEFLVVPWGEGVLFPVNGESFWQEKYSFYDWKSTLSICGLTNLESGCFIISDNPWDCGIDYGRGGNGLLSLNMYHEPIKKRWGEDRVFYWGLIGDKGYNEMAYKYRQHREARETVRTFEKKIIDNPNMKGLEGAVDLWVLGDELFRPDYVDSLTFWGIDRAVVSLSGGWYLDMDMSETRRACKDAGFIASRYDIYTDVWPPLYPDKPWFRVSGYPEDVIVERDGSLRKGWLAYVDGKPFQGYYTCSATHKETARPRLEEDLAKYSLTGRFIDVELASGLYECYSEIHPLTRKEDAYQRTELMKMVKDEYGLVTGGEEARDWAFSYVDFGEGTMTVFPAKNAGYDWAEPTDTPGVNYEKYSFNPKTRIPLKSLAFHDTHVSTWYTGDGATKVPFYREDKELYNILYATMPLWLFDEASLWNDNREELITSFHLISIITRDCGFSPMLEHGFLNDERTLQYSLLEENWKIVVNFSPSSAYYEDLELPGKGFYATNGAIKSGRILKGGNKQAFAYNDSLFFFQPYGKEQGDHGVYSQGSVLLKKQSDGIRLVLVGEQRKIEIEGEDLLWPMKNIRCYREDTHEEINLKSGDEGRLVLEKSEEQRGYLIKGEWNTSIGGKSGAFENKKIECFPNPFSKLLFIRLEGVQEGIRCCSIFNLLGEKVKEFQNIEKEVPCFELTWDGKDDSGEEVSSGLYLLVFENGETRIVKKLCLLK